MPINREGSNSAVPIKKNPMLASPNTILYTKEAVRFIVLNNILTTAFIDLESIFSDYFVQSSVLQFKCVPFVNCQVPGKGQPYDQRLMLTTEASWCNNFRRFRNGTSYMLGEKKEWVEKCLKYLYTLFQGNNF